jgi:hypothetical protein
MKKILILLLLYGGFLQAQIVPCPTFYSNVYKHKVDSTFLNTTGDSIIVVDNGVRTAIPIRGVFMDTSYTNSTRDTLFYTKGGITYKVPLNKVDTSSFFYALNQINSTTIVWKRKDGTADTVDFSSLCESGDSVWYKSDTLFVKTSLGTTAYPQTKYVDSIYQNTAKDSLFWTKNGVTIGYKLGGSTVNSATHEVVATAGQTIFPLPHTPITSIAWSFRNGARLPKGAMIVSGSTATYIPSANNNNILFAGDRIQFDYIY